MPPKMATTPALPAAAKKASNDLGRPVWNCPDPRPTALIDAWDNPAWNRQQHADGGGNDRRRPGRILPVRGKDGRPGARHRGTDDPAVHRAARTRAIYDRSQEDGEVR